MEAPGYVLLTGGAGYVGQHVIVELIAAGFQPVAIDIRQDALTDCTKRIEEVTGVRVKSYVVDMLDKKALDSVFKMQKVDYVLHLAGLKAVRESHTNPMAFYKVNVIASINLFEVMSENGVYNIIFSSSSKVYGVPQYLPIDENHPTGNCTNPYGRTKYMVEQILKDLASADSRWNVTVLRYFNPSGSHDSGKLGENGSFQPVNLMPCICLVAMGKLKQLSVYGHDYNTPDGTALKAYIHIVDLAKGHIDAMQASRNCENYKVYNLGQGGTHSVLDIVKIFEKISGNKIPVKLCDRKPGELAECSAESSKALRELGWKPERTLEQMCVDMWNWALAHNEGEPGPSLS